MIAINRAQEVNSWRSEKQTVRGVKSGLLEKRKRKGVRRRRKANWGKIGKQFDAYWRRQKREANWWSSEELTWGEAKKWEA